MLQLSCSHIGFFSIFPVMINNDCCTLWPSPKPVRLNQLIFHKIIKLIVKDSFNYLGHTGQKTNTSVVLLVHTIQYFISLGKVFSVILLLITLVIMGRYESQNCLRILAGIAPWHIAFFKFKFMISYLASFSCPF